MPIDHPMYPVVPPALLPGDTIGLVAPAGPLLHEEELTAAIRLLGEMGYKVRFDRALLGKSGYLAGSDEQRAQQFNSMWAASDVKALLAVRGGYGSLRMVDLLDMELIRRHPKILIGYSDITVLLHAIFKATGLVTFLGPVATSLPRCDHASRATFSGMLAGRYAVEYEPTVLDVLVGGEAQGRLLGGNLTSLVHLLATPYELSWDNAILLLEEVGESIYRIDRMLTHLAKAGRFSGLAGLILGSFTEAPFAQPVDNAAVNQRILELFAEHNIPIWSNFPVGHTNRNLTLPMGLEAKMDSATGSLQLLPPGV